MSCIVLKGINLLVLDPISYDLLPCASGELSSLATRLLDQHSLSSIVIGRQGVFMNLNGRSFLGWNTLDASINSSKLG